VTGAITLPRVSASRSSRGGASASPRSAWCGFLIALHSVGADRRTSGRGAPMAEHRLYLPSIGFFSLYRRAPRSNRVAPGSGQRQDVGRDRRLRRRVIALLAAGTVVRHRAMEHAGVALGRRGGRNRRATSRRNTAWAKRTAWRPTARTPGKAYQRAMAIRPNVSRPYIGYAMVPVGPGPTRAARSAGARGGTGSARRASTCGATQWSRPRSSATPLAPPRSAARGQSRTQRSRGDRLPWTRAPLTRSRPTPDRSELTDARDGPGTVPHSEGT
jgi:hypothetical protein